MSHGVSVLPGTCVSTDCEWTPESGSSWKGQERPCWALKGIQNKGASVLGGAKKQQNEAQVRVKVLLASEAGGLGLWSVVLGQLEVPVGPRSSWSTPTPGHAWDSRH